MIWKGLEIQRNRPVVIGSSKVTNETSTKYSTGFDLTFQNDL